MDGSLSSTSSQSGQQQSRWYQEIEKTVLDCHLPTVAFLIHDLNKAASSEPTAGTVPELLEAFKKAVDDKSMEELKRYLQNYLLIVENQKNEKARQINTKQSTSYVEDDKLDECDEAVLRIHEVMLLSRCQVPQDLNKVFTEICNDKKIPTKTIDGKTREFFVYAENKALTKMCDALSEEEVMQMYNNLWKSKIRADQNSTDHGQESKTGIHFSATGSGRKLMNLSVSISDMKTVQGLKKASFYCFVLALFKEDLLSRIHMDTLAEYLQQKETRNLSHPITSVLRRYPLESNPPGLCIIFNMEDTREGANLDYSNIASLFKDTFKYDVICKKDPTKHDVYKTIFNLDDEKFKFHDSLVIVFMSHGNKTHLKVADGELHRRRDLIEPITKIGWLANKPKLFFVQACAIKTQKNTGQNDYDEERCDAEGMGKVCNTLYGHNITLRDLHPFADTLVSYATKWYDTASRTPGEGSLYINTLVEQLKEFGSKEPIQEVLQRVHYHVNMVDLGTRQAPYFESSLQKAFIFPGVRPKRKRDDLS